VLHGFGWLVSWLSEDFTGLQIEYVSDVAACRWRSTTQTCSSEDYIFIYAVYVLMLILAIGSVMKEMERKKSVASDEHCSVLHRPFVYLHLLMTIMCRNM